MESRSKSSRDSLVWQMAHAFALAIYRATEAFPKHEMFALTSQLRRAAASIPANFVEGFRKRTTPDKLRFYNIAQGSADPCLFQLTLTGELRYAGSTSLQGDLEEVSRILQGDIKGLERGAS